MHVAGAGRIQPIGKISFFPNQLGISTRQFQPIMNFKVPTFSESKVVRATSVMTQSGLVNVNKAIVNGQINLIDARVVV
jgi:hypothetical protein